MVFWCGARSGQIVDGYTAPHVAIFLTLCWPNWALALSAAWRPPILVGFAKFVKWVHSLIKVHPQHGWYVLEASVISRCKNYFLLGRTEAWLLMPCNSPNLNMINVDRSWLNEEHLLKWLMEVWLQSFLSICNEVLKFENKCFPHFFIQISNIYGSIDTFIISIILIHWF